MNNYSQLIFDNPLFSNIPPDHFPAVSDCMNSFTQTFQSRTLLFGAGSKITRFGLLLKGTVEIFLLGSNGTHTLISLVSPGELFCHSLAVAEAADHLFMIYASEGSEILFLHVPKFTAAGNCHCACRYKVMENLMKLIAKDNMNLTMKVQILTQGSLREKLMLYFSFLAKEQHSNTILLPFGRDKLASYLFCNRSAVSRELGRMQKEGLLSIHKNEITLPA